MTPREHPGPAAMSLPVMGPAAAARVARHLATAHEELARREAGQETKTA